MPLYEYECKKCGHRFEALVMGSTKVTCPSCRSAELEQAVSGFAMSSKGGGGSTRSFGSGGCAPNSGGG